MNGAAAIMPLTFKESVLESGREMLLPISGSAGAVVFRRSEGGLA